MIVSDRAIAMWCLTFALFLAVGQFDSAMTCAKRPSASASNSNKERALYIQRFGSSDLPIFPVVIYTNKPKQTELRANITDLLSYASFFHIAVDDLAAMTDVVRRFGAQEHERKREAPLAAEGAFRFTVATTGGVEKIELSMNDTRSVLAELANISRKRYPDLQKHLVSMLQMMHSGAD